MAALFGLGPTGPVSIQIGSGLALSVNTLMATGGPAATQTLSLYALGNTTSSTSSAVGGAGSLSLSGAGLVSIGLSGSVYVISAAATAASATSMGQTALGNTAGSTSSQTRALTAESLSFAGIVSGGFSGGTLVISASSGTTAASGTALSRFAIGNTTGSTSSDVATLTQWTVSGAGGLSAGMSGGTLVLSGATTVAQSVQTLGLFAVGNTTTSVSSMTADARSLSFDGAGLVSIGMSGGSIVISASSGTTAASATSMNMTAIGNTTGSSSATTRLITEQTLSGAGIVSVGFSGNSIIISASSGTTAASGTVQNRFALGNTTAATSSFAGTLSIFSVSGAGGVSAGYDTNGVLVISGATDAGASATSMGLTALGNTTGSTSSMTQALTAESISFAGGVSGGFSGGTFVISGATGTQLGLSTLSYFQPTPFYSSTTIAPGNAAMAVQPLALPAPLTINQVRMMMSFALVAATLTVGTAAAASMTATASYANNRSNTLVHYSQVDASTFTSVGSTSLLIGFSQSWSVSQTNASNSVSCSITYAYGIGTTTSQDTFSTSGSTNTTSSYAFTFAGSASYNSVIGMDHAWAKSFAAGLHLLGAMSNSGTTRATGSSLISVSTGGLPPGWIGSLVCVAVSGNGFQRNPGPSAGSAGFPYGVGYTTSTNGVNVGSAPASVVAPSLVYGASLLRIPYIELGVF